MSVASGSPSGGCVFFVLEAATRCWRMPFVLAVVAMVAGCMGPTRTGASLDALSAPKPGLARIVVLRDKAYPGMFDIGWKVYLDEAAMGDLKTGTFVYSDRPAGPHQLFFARPGDLSRGSQQSFSAAPGRTYFFRLDMNEKGRLVAASGGAVGEAGLLVSSAVSAAADERGLFDFIPLDEAAAQAAVAELRLAD